MDFSLLKFVNSKKFDHILKLLTVKIAKSKVLKIFKIIFVTSSVDNRKICNDTFNVIEEV